MEDFCVVMVKDAFQLFQGFDRGGRRHGEKRRRQGGAVRGMPELVDALKLVLVVCCVTDDCFECPQVRASNVLCD